MLKVYWARLDELNVDEKSLSSDRLSRIAHVTDERHKKQMIAAEMLLQKALNECFGLNVPVQYSRTQYGKPYIPERDDIHFSLSHSGDIVAVCVSDTPVGIDVEQLRGYRAGIAQRFFTPQEAADVTLSCDRARRFYAYWTSKESFVKCDGRGMSYGFKNFLITPRGEVYRDAERQNVELKMYRVDDYYISVCKKLP